MALPESAYPAALVEVMRDHHHVRPCRRRRALTLLYISDPRSPQETDRPFAEPGLFLVNPQGNAQIIDVSNAPFARPDLQMILNGIKTIIEKSYPVRGTHG